MSERAGRVAMFAGDEDEDESVEFVDVWSEDAKEVASVEEGGKRQ